MQPATHDMLVRRAKHLGVLPAMPQILTTLNESLGANSGMADIDKIVETISCDESLAAQCLRVANSALYGHRGDVATIRDAVLTLGLWRIRDLAFSCNLPLMFSGFRCAVPKETFWRHSLATAFIAEKLGSDFMSPASQHVYLAGLLHDIGILINALLFPEKFSEVLEEATLEHSMVDCMEQRLLGFTHADSGRIVAEEWKLPREIADVIEFHHHPEAQAGNNEVTVIVQAANQMCWNSGLGYGYSLQAEAFCLLENPWRILSERFPKANRIRPEDYVAVLEAHLFGAHELADRVFRLTPQQAI